MGIVNRRNAVVGWIVLKVGKRVAKKKAQEAGPAAARKAGPAAGALAALGGVLFFWRKKKRGTETE